MDAPIRCKFFDDDGNPIDKGCRFGNRCRYIHPSDSIWKTTSSYRGRNTHDRFKDDRANWQDDFAYSSRAPRDDLQRDSVSRAEREKGGISRGGRDIGHTRDLSSGFSWSTSAGDSTIKSSFGSTPITGKPTESSAPTQGGWSTASTIGGSSAWDTAGGSSSWNTGGWDDTTTEGGSSSNPWGGTSTAWGDGGWGSSDWGNNIWGGNDKAQQNKTVKTDGSNPALLTHQLVPNSPSLLSQNPSISRVTRFIDHQREVPNRPSSSPKAATDDMIKPTVEPSPGSSSAPTPAVKRPRLPLPTRLQKQTPLTTAHVQGVIDGQKLPPPSPVTSQDWSQLPLSGSIAGLPQQDDVASDASGSIAVLSALDPHELHSRLIKEMTRAIFIRYNLVKAEEQKDKWRKARQSSCYQHSTPAAQKILESTNHKGSEELAKLNKQLSLSLKRIVKFSNTLSVHRGLLEIGFDMKKVMMYTDELRDWIIDLELPRRVFTATSRIDGEKREREAAQKQKREKVTMLRNAVYGLELIIADVSDDLAHMQDSQPKSFQEAFHTINKILEEEGPEHVPDMDKLFSMLGVGADAAAAAKQQIQMMDQKVVNQSLKIEGLRANLKALEVEVANLKQSEAEIAVYLQEASTRLKEMEMWKRDDKTQLDQLSKKIEILHQQSPYSHPQSSSSLFSCKVDDLLPYTDALVTACVMQEIKPALDAIVAGVDINSHHLAIQFNKLVEQVVIKTYNLVQMALKVNGLIPQFYLI